MGRTAEKKRARRTIKLEEDDEKPDRLSDLPDAIIHQILAFLDIKDTIKTCVLSKRWKYLWVSLGDLKIDGDRFTYSKFTKFVRKVLSTRANCNICKFQLCYDYNLDRSLVKRIIKYVGSHNIQHLDLRVGHRHYPYCLFRPLQTCNTLKTLKINNVLLEDLPESFGFGFKMLTSLDLSDCKFCYEGGSADPFASCPNLKNLCLGKCSFSSLQVLKISGLQLLNLRIKDAGEFISNHLKVEIFAPKLLSFNLITVAIFDFSFLDIPSVNYANIWLYRSVRSYASVVEKENHILRLIKLFQGLYNAQVVMLSDDTIKCLDRFPHLLEQQPSPFKRLNSLKVEREGKSLVIPDHVKTYFLGDNCHEETTYKEASPEGYGTTNIVEFHKEGEVAPPRPSREVTPPRPSPSRGRKSPRVLREVCGDQESTRTFVSSSSDHEGSDDNVMERYSSTSSDSASHNPSDAKGDAVERSSSSSPDPASLNHPDAEDDAVERSSFSSPDPGSLNASNAKEEEHVDYGTYGDSDATEREERDVTEIEERDVTERETVVDHDGPSDAQSPPPPQVSSALDVGEVENLMKSIDTEPTIEFHGMTMRSSCAEALVPLVAAYGKFWDTPEAPTFIHRYILEEIGKTLVLSRFPRRVLTHQRLVGILTTLKGVDDLGCLVPPLKALRDKITLLSDSSSSSSTLEAMKAEYTRLTEVVAFAQNEVEVTRCSRDTAREALRVAKSKLSAAKKAKKEASSSVADFERKIDDFKALHSEDIPLFVS